MTNRSPSRVLAYLLILCGLTVGNGALAYLLFVPHPPVLKVSFLSIGQGDSILIQGPTGVKMLVDGGPDGSVLTQLSKELLPWDRHFDLLVETHPDKDHIYGLGDVLARYKVSNYMDPGIPDTTKASAHVMQAVAAEPGLHRILARRGMRLHLGGGAYADVLFPDRDESKQTATNDGSVVLHVVYGATSVLLTGDLPSPYEDYLVGLDGKDGELASDVLKAGHHGSKYSTDSLWLSAVHPRVVVISAGKHNVYGFPAPPTVARIKASGAQMVSTIDLGTIDFVSDGRTIAQK